MHVVLGMHRDDFLDLVAPEDHADYDFLISQADVHSVALHAEGAARKLHLIAAVEGIDEFAQERVAAYLHAAAHLDDVLVEVLGIAHAV